MDAILSPGMTDIDGASTSEVDDARHDVTCQASTLHNVDDYTLYDPPASFVRNTSKEKHDTVDNHHQLGSGLRSGGLLPEGPVYRPLSTSPRLAGSPRLPSPRQLGTVVEAPASNSDSDNNDGDNDSSHDKLSKSQVGLSVAKGNAHSHLSNENISDEKTHTPQGAGGGSGGSGGGGLSSLINAKQCPECCAGESTIQQGGDPCSGNVSHNCTDKSTSEMARWSPPHKPELPTQSDPSGSRTPPRISAIRDDGFRTWVRNNRLSGNYGGMTRPNEGEGSYMDKIKVVAGRLNLATRRPSVQEWRERVIDCPPGSLRTLGTNRKHSLEDFGDVKDDSEAGEWSGERRERINDALSWLRRELVYMKEQDQTLARCLVMLRHDIQQVKLARSYAEHQESIDDAVDELEEERHLAGHSDLPPEHFPTSLKQFGVTRMNINSRRFSVF